MKQTGIALAKAFQKTYEKFEENCKADTKAAGKIIESIVKELGLDKLQTPSDIQHDVDFKAEQEKRARKEHEDTVRKETIRKRNVLKLRIMVSETDYALRPDATANGYDAWISKSAKELTEIATANW